MPFIKAYEKSNRNILRISFEREVINLNPAYQRNGEIWNLEKRQLLIDSILNDYDIPKIYFNVVTNKKSKFEFEVIDGRQRLETIWLFIDGKVKLAEDFIYLKDKKIKASGLTYPELAIKYPRLKGLFDSFNLPIVCVETDDLELIDDMFLRLNEAVPLNAAEKRNAIGGPLVKAINDISTHTFFKTKVKISNKRYQHKEIACRLLYLIKCIEQDSRLYDTKKLFLDEFVRSAKNAEIKLSDVGLIQKNTKSCLDSLCKIFNDADELLRAQSSVPIYFLLYYLSKKPLKKDLRAKLLEFRDEVVANKDVAETDLSKANYDLIEYDRASVQGTNDASSLYLRLKIIANYLEIPLRTFE
ncbi:MAG: DUF262 domain-containing protein [Bdellovibrionota bacterium]